MINYKLSKEKPPVFDRLQKAFGLKWEDVIITYGDTIYCANDLPEYSIAHELVHIEQQALFNKEEWLEAYIADPKFRLQVEIPAYQAEVQYLKDHPEALSLDRAKQWIEHLAECLSGPMYGNMVTPQDAMNILNYDGKDVLKADGPAMALHKKLLSEQTQPITINSENVEKFMRRMVNLSRQMNNLQIHPLYDIPSRKITKEEFEGLDFVVDIKNARK